MPSANKSEKLGLNLWAESDRPQRGDFNGDNMILDQVLGEHLENSELHLTKEEKSRVFAPITDAGYIGDGSEVREILLPCRAQAVMVFCEGMPCALYDEIKKCTKIYSGFFANGAGSQSGVSVLDKTLTVTQQTGSSEGFMICLNEEGKHYSAVVLR